MSAQHNARYNYFAGMSPDEIEAAQSPIAGWERATRAFATNGADRGPAWSDFADPLDAIARAFRPELRRAAVDRFTAGERHALGVMGLKDDVDRTRAAQALFGAGAPLSPRPQRRRPQPRGASWAR